MKLIPIIQKINRIKRDISENQTLISTILPVFRYLGWDVFNENRVIFEDVTATKKRVDLTFVSEDNTKFIIEAKRLSHKLVIKDFEQLTVYLNSDNSVNFGILTNGVDYWIADNKGEGLDEKKIYQFNVFDITECDINILKMFFSFNSSHKFEVLNKYINYIKTGVDFGDKECIKVLEIKGFEIDKEIKAKSIKELQVEKNIKKPKFDKLNILENFNRNELLDKESIKKEIKKISKKEVENSDEVKKTKTEPISIDHIEKKGFSEDIEDSKSDSNVEIIKAEGEIEFFELIEKNRARIYINGEYHIIKEETFSLLFIKMIKYTLDKVRLYPTLFNKVVEKFDFIVRTVSRDNQSEKYEKISEGYYFNTDTNNYTKLKNIEAVLRYIDKYSE